MPPKIRTRTDPPHPRRDVDPLTGIGHPEQIPDVAPNGTGGALPGPAPDPLGIGRR